MNFDLDLYHPLKDYFDYIPLTVLIISLTDCLVLKELYPIISQVSNNNVTFHTVEF